MGYGNYIVSRDHIGDNVVKIRPMGYGNEIKYVLRHWRFVIVVKIRPMGYGNIKIDENDLSLKKVVKIRPMGYGNNVIFSTSTISKVVLK